MHPEFMFSVSECHSKIQTFDLWDDAKYKRRTTCTCEQNCILRIETITKYAFFKDKTHDTTCICLEFIRDIILQIWLVKKVIRTSTNIQNLNTYPIKVNRSIIFSTQSFPKVFKAFWKKLSVTFSFRATLDKAKDYKGRY